jgi:DNA (cytosine-5)-methyltransferase 1
MSAFDRPTMVELAGCQGGMTKGYQDAGWYVIAVDIADHSDRSPADEYLVIRPEQSFDVIADLAPRADAFHAGWPCQKYTHGNAANDTSDLPDLLTPGRAALQATGRPYVIENVPRAPLVNPMTLCGSMFGLTTVDDDGTVLHLRRHRLFESNVLLVPPGPCVHPRGVQWAGSYGGARRDKVEARTVRKGGYVPPKPVLERLLRIDWMNEYGLFQAIPPIYATHIGLQLIEASTRRTVA